ncbi:MAG: S8 family serine peptidase, partial [Candidatus Bathyarchaeota archaeon]
NGRENLDDPIYDVNPAPPDGPFPSWWINPYKRKPLDSGAIVVGAGAPPPGTHGRNHGPDRSRLDFSNYGSLVDAQGWGREVTSCGYGDLQGGSDKDLLYTDTFSGTSSASPIVVGALGCVQGFCRAKSKTLWTPATARTMLRATGSPQQDAPTRPATQRIGNRPNLRQLIIDCFIASAAYGSGLAPEVQLLREFRDDVLLKSSYKRAFESLLDVYYSLSPAIAHRMEGNEAFKDTMRRTLVRPTVEVLKAVVRWMKSSRKING